MTDVKHMGVIGNLLMYMCVCVCVCACSMNISVTF